MTIGSGKSYVKKVPQGLFEQSACTDEASHFGNLVGFIQGHALGHKT